MPGMRTPWATYIDRQHRNPSGVVGQIIGRRMQRQHTPETHWSVELLQIQAGDRILEIGFGAGRGLALALQHAPRGLVAGVDLSPTMIHAARRCNSAASRRGQLALVRGNVAELPFGEQRFDKIFSIHTFYFWPDARAVFSRLIDLLTQGGRLVSTFASARRRSDGEWEFWDIQHEAETLVETLEQQPDISARLLYGPDSREYNNVAIVIDKGRPA